MDKVTCLVCTEEYWTGVRDPLMLPCGHTYCRQCIISLIKRHKIECPTCRRLHHSLNVEKLPTNFAMLSIAMTKNMLDTCLEHGDPLRFWCMDCQEMGCGECMIDSHTKDQHHIVNIRVRLQEKRKSLKDQVDKLLQTIKQEMVDRESSFRSCEAIMLRLLRQSRDIYNLDKQLGDMSQEIDTITGRTSLNSAEAAVTTLQEKIYCTLNRFSEEDCETSAGGSSSSSRSCEGAAASGIMCPLGMKVTKFGGQESRLVWQDGRLLLCTIRYKSQPQPFQLVAVGSLVTSEAAEVFLELSVGQVILGRVYIQLWNHLRRAQHFLALCLGTFGPSFLGTNLLEITFRNDPEESVTCGDYIDQDGIITAEAIMSDLEWDGIYAGERREGLVVASSGGAQEFDARFGISTSRRARGWVRCPFAEVVSGMEVVRKALEHDPVSRVSVSGCGLVLKPRP